MESTGRKRKAASGRHVTTLLGMMLLGVSLLVPSAFAAGNAAQETPGTSAAPAAAPAAGRIIYMPVINKEVSNTPSIFGVQMYGNLNSAEAGLNLVPESQADWVRWPIFWSDIEPTNTTPDQYNWSAVDASLLAADQAGLRPIVTIRRNPAWAATYADGPIDKVPMSQFQEFIGALVERYDGDGNNDAPGSPVAHYWEFYNEPDHGDAERAEYDSAYWGPFGDKYAQMLCSIYPLVKAANPQAQVTFGGVAYDWFDDQGGPFTRRFVDDVLANGGGDCFDVMNFHYYPAFAADWAAYGPGLAGKANFLHNKMAEYGVGGKPMIVTEAGWHSVDWNQYPSTPDNQARIVLKFLTQSMASDLDVMIWWSWKDPGSWYAANGLLTEGLQKKPSFDAYRVAAGKIGQATFERALSADEMGSGQLEGYAFRAQRPLYVLWSNGDPATVSLPHGRIRMIDKLGNTIGEAGDGRVTVGSDPIYVEVLP